MNDGDQVGGASRAMLLGFAAEYLFPTLQKSFLTEKIFLDKESKGRLYAVLRNLSSGF